MKQEPHKPQILSENSKKSNDQLKAPKYKIILKAIFLTIPILIISILLMFFSGVGGFITGCFRGLNIAKKIIIVAASSDHETRVQIMNELKRRR